MGKGNGRWREGLLGIAMALLLLLVLAACGGGNEEANNAGTDANTAAQAPAAGTEQTGEEPAGETGGAEANQGADDEAAGPAAEGGSEISSSDKELFVKIVGDAAELTSYKVNMTSEQDMEIGGTPQSSTSQIEMTAVLQPSFTFHQMTTMDAGMGEQTVESYMLEDGLYMKDPTQGKWMKYPTNMSEQLMNAAGGGGGMNPTEVLEQMSNYADELSIEEEGDTYVIVLSAKDTDLSQMLGGGEAAGGSMNIQDLQYELVVDKKTHYPLQMDITMAMTMGEGENQTKTTSKTSAVYSEHNAITGLDVPAEVREAETMTMPGTGQ
ncbi:hypothetical protein IDH44_06745 [Paenibacillus sp. IB182496]|uniref:Lipoprotein n=1 Tax=Paenibacillus sabuli TaxID=2772509 RepID=A0A927BSI7_9BACL|nr:DUF6612 family protein [Paenibacillus sabuli]MBD2844885.1 hypothetical protein [Paenibacillus sabuli]